jgi:hypothetical protein
MSALAEIVLIGVVATLAIDFWQAVLHLVAGFPAADWGLVGRWIGWMPRGVFLHRPITATPKVRGEAIIGWAFHYAVGIVYAALYVAVLHLLPASTPLLLPALAVAVAALIAPWFVMQPALGRGIMASNTPNPAAARMLSLMGHLIFGLGLYAGTLVWVDGFAG